LIDAPPFAVEFFDDSTFWAHRMGAVAKSMGSSEFTTWVALAGAAILAGLTAIYSSSPWVLIAAALIGAYLGYRGERLGRDYLERRLARKQSR
jgi:hypothetical protein